MQENQIPGLALAIERKGEIIYEKYFGIESIRTNSKVDQNTVFRLYSISKVMSSLAIFKLQEENRINIDDDLSKWIKGLPNSWNHIKIHNLLSHSSGLPDYFHLDLSLSDKEIWSQLYKIPLDFKAGEKFSYNQTNFWMLTLIIEQVSNMSYEDFIRTTQFEENEIIYFNSNHTDKLKN